MKLTFDMIKEITVGAINITEEGDGIRFYKSVPRQIDAWYAYSDILGHRAETTTGIRLDFYTDSKNFSFAVPKDNGARFELQINREHSRFVNEEDFCNGRFDFVLNCEERKENRVTLIFPSHDIGILASVELDDGAYFKRHTFDRRILFIGDSITQGWNSGTDSLSYAYRVSDYFNAESVIQGVGGGFFCDTIIEKAEGFEPELVITAFGCNDYDRHKTPEVIRSKMGAYFKKLKALYPEAKLAALSPINRLTKPKPHELMDIDKCNSVIKEATLSNGIILIDGSDFVPAEEKYFADALHPNAEGFGVYAKALIPELERLF